MIRLIVVKHSRYSHYFIYDSLEDKHKRGMLPLVSFSNTLAIRFTQEIDTNKYLYIMFSSRKNNAYLKLCSV